MFGRVDFREDEKKKREREKENEERKLFEKCLVGRGREENDGKVLVFSL